MLHHLWRFHAGVRVGLACAAFLLAGARQCPAAEEATRIDLTGIAGGVAVFQGQARGQSAQAMDDASGKRLEIRWDAGRFAYLELNLNTQLALPDFAAARACVNLMIPELSTLRGVALRGLDASGEVFQFRLKRSGGTAPAAESAAGTAAFEGVISQRTVEGCWGGNGNKMIDPPLRLLGLAFDYRAHPATGSVQVSGIEILPLPDTRRDASYRLHRFDKMELWTAQFPGGSGTCSAQADALTVISKADRAVLREKKWELQTQERFHALTLSAELVRGQATLQFLLRGENGQQASTEPVALQAGANVLRLDTAAPAFAKLAGRLRLVALTINTPGKDSELRLRGLDVVRRQEALDAVSATIETGNALRVLPQGQEDAFALRLRNHGSAPLTVVAEATFSDLTGRAAPVRTQVEIPAGGESLWKPAWKPERLGHWRMRLELRDAAAVTAGNPQTPLVREDAFAYIKPAGPTPGRAEGFLFSISTHTESWSLGEQELEALASGLCGAKVIRTGPVWTAVQPEPQRWNWESLDRLVDLYGKDGMELQYIFMFPPRWACPPEIRKSTNWKDFMSCAPESQPWQNFVKTVCARYSGRIRFWEIWNEPDLTGFANFSSDEYVRLLKEAYQSAHAADPQARVMTGGFATLTEHGGRREKDFQQNALRNGLGFYDIHAYHEHGTFEAFARIVDTQFLPMRAATGADKTPWYANETSINSLWAGETGQAATLFKKLLFAWSRGAIGYTWYDLRNDGFNMADPEHSYGMLTNDFQPKPVYAAYAALAGAYTGASFAGALKGAGGLWALHFQRGADRLLPSWREERADAQALLIRTDARAAETIDLMGNHTPAPLQEGFALLEYGELPGTLLLRGASKAEPAGDLLAASGQLYITPGQPSILHIKARNPLGQPAAFRLSLALPAGLTADKPAQEQTLAANADAEFRFTMQDAPDFKPDFGKPLSAKLTYAAGNWRGALTIPLTCAIRIPAREQADATFDFTLKDRAQAVPLFANDPNNKHLVWQGAEDLSARVRLSESDNALRLTVIVRDDKHAAPFAGVEIWKGDSIQFGIQKPGDSGFWEIGLAQDDAGKPQTFVWSAPAGAVAARLAEAITLSVSGSGNERTYQAELPLAALGLSRDDLRAGIRFNLLVNDNDEGKRESWLQLAPHLGQDKQPGKFPLLLFAPAVGQQAR